MPRPETKDSWETRSRDFFDSKLGTRITTISHTLNRPEARVAIFGDSQILTIEASLPKLLYGTNLATVNDASEALTSLREFVGQYVEGDIPELGEMDYLRVDYAYNFRLGSALPDYVDTLSQVGFLKHRRTTDIHGGVEWWSENGRRIRAYDKYKEILEKDKKRIPEARGVLRFEIQLRKKSRFLERRLGHGSGKKSASLPWRQHNEKLTLQDVLKAELAYGCLVETLNKMCLGVDFQTQDSARELLDRTFSYRKATRLLGLVRRLETESMEAIRERSQRSTYYSDKKELRGLGLWPPSAGPVSLPALAMPPLETLLSAGAVPCDFIYTEKAA